MYTSFAHLVELATLLFSKKLHNVGFQNKKDTYLMQLYKGIATGKFKSDKEAAQTIYNATANDSRYKQLRYRLKKRLFKSIFLIDIDKEAYSHMQMAHYNCYQDIAAMSILSTHAAKITSIAVAEKAIVDAIKYELTDQILTFANKLEDDYCNTDSNKYLHYAAIRDQYEGIQSIERKATKYNRHLYHLHLGKQAHDDTHLAQAIVYEESIKSLLPKCNSRTFLLYGYTTIAMRYEIANDYKAAIAVCDQAIAAFQAKTAETAIAYNLASFVFLYRKVAYYTTLKDYEQAGKAAQKCLTYIKSGGNNWYNILKECVTLSLHTKDYQSAYNFLEQAVNHPKYTTKSKKQKERWMLFRAYIAYFIAHHDEAISIEEYFPKQHHKFWYEVPSFDKKKWDHHVPILFVHILYFSKAKEYDIVANRVAEAKRYFSKNLMNDATFRANCLTKMLNIMVEEASFNKNATIRKAERFLVRLRAHPLEKSKQASNVEIVPYEDIWDCVLDNLKTDYWHD